MGEGWEGNLLRHFRTLLGLQFQTKFLQTSTIGREEMMKGVCNMI